MNIQDLVKEAHENAKKHGFWEDVEMLVHEYDEIDILEAAMCKEWIDGCKSDLSNAICTRLMLIVGEVAEAMEGLRKNDRANFQEELADIMIRVFDLAGGLEVDLESEIKKKMEMNKSRFYKHGKSF